MVEDDSGSFDRRLETLTETFVERVADCLEYLPALVDRYADGEPYVEDVQRVQALESECDRTYREVSALVATATERDLGIRLTGVYLNRDQLLELFRRLDEVANATERFASDLAAIEPPRLEAPLDGLREMAELATEGMQYLENAVTDLVRALCNPDEVAPVADVVESIRRTESAVDELRDGVVSVAFERESHAVALVYRELALLLDGVLDAMEDTTDLMFVVDGDSREIDFELTTDVE